MLLAKRFPSYYVYVSNVVSVVKFQILVHSKPPACGKFAMAPPKRAHGIWPLSAAVETNPGPLFERAAKGPWKISLVKRKGKQKKVCAKNLRYSNTEYGTWLKGMNWWTNPFRSLMLLTSGKSHVYDSILQEESWQQAQHQPASLCAGSVALLMLPQMNSEGNMDVLNPLFFNRVVFLLEIYETGKS